MQPAPLQKTVPAIKRCSCHDHPASHSFATWNPCCVYTRTGWQSQETSMRPCMHCCVQDCMAVTQHIMNIMHALLYTRMNAVTRLCHQHHACTAVYRTAWQSHNMSLTPGIALHRTARQPQDTSLKPHMHCCIQDWMTVTKHIMNIMHALLYTRLNAVTRLCHQHHACNALYRTAWHIWRRGTDTTNLCLSTTGQSEPTQSWSIALSGAYRTYGPKALLSNNASLST